MILEYAEGHQPFMAVAVHNGHRVRPDLMKLMAVDERTRFRFESPYTRFWTAIADTSITVNTSRFEIDMNRERSCALYKTPEDAWGLELWKERPAPAANAHSMQEYDHFYKVLHRACAKMKREFGRFFVFDLQTYNHRPYGPKEPPVDPLQYPDIDVGTGGLNRDHWESLLERFIGDLRSYNYHGRQLNVGENVTFSGGHVGRYIQETFEDSGCVLSLRVKKFFMDEWTGVPDWAQLAGVREALRSTIPGVLEAVTGRADAHLTMNKALIGCFS